MATGRYHWSNAAYAARFFVINVTAFIPVVGLILHISWFMLYLSLGFVAFFFWIERVRKMSMSAFRRSLNIVLTGRIKSTMNLLEERAR
jgi:hypothetical protein